MFLKVTRLALLSSALGLVIILISFTEQSNLEELLYHYRENTPSERIYLQIDRELYQPGDTVWFSAYNRDFRKQSLSLASNYLHLTLLSPEGKEIMRENFYLSKAKAKGDILLPIQLEEGDYNLIAYTSWMKKGSPKNIFKKIISVRKVIPSPFNFRSILNDSLYNTGDKVTMDIIVETPGNKILNNLKISWSLNSEDKRLEKGVIRSDEEGIAKLEFIVPELQNPSSLLVKLESEFLEVNRQAVILIPTPSSKIDLQFLPEGGSFISGLKNKIAFKALNVLGEPVNLTGYLEDEKGERVVDSISSTFKGMGYFSFTPDFSGKYHFRVLKPDIYAGSYPLPHPDSAGLALSVDSNKKRLEISVTRSEGYNEYDDLVICGILNDSIMFIDEIPDNQNLYKSSLEAKDFPAGIIRFCVMKNIHPILERLVFVNPEKNINLQLKTSRKRYRARDKVNLEIVAKDNNGQAVEGNFSLSFANIQNSPTQGGSNINSWFLLNSELKGEIPDPGYYFSNRPGSIEALDLVMLTNGWRGFTWEEVIRVQQNNDFLDLNPEALRGKVENQRGKPVKRGNVTLLNTKIFGVEQTTTDREGYFSFTPSQFMMLNMSDMTLNAETSSGGKNVRVFIEEPFHDSLLSLYSNKNMEKLQSESDASEENLINVELDQPVRSFDNPVNITYGYFQFEEVSVKAGREVINVSDEEKSETVMKLEKKGEALSPANSNSFIDILRQVDPGFTISDGGKVLFRGNNSIYGNRQSGALFVLNGVPIGDNINQLNFIEPQSIDKIVITKNASAALKYRGGYLSGLIEITTKDDIVYKTPEQDLREKNLTTVQGFRLSRNFYSPDYSRMKKKNYLDIRNTIYWNAEIKTDAEGKANVTFFNPDVRSDVIGIIEGWSKDGKLLGTGKVMYEIY